MADELTDIKEVDIPTKTYKVVNGRITGYVDGLPAMRQAIEKLLSTERFVWSIYSDNYGVEIDNLIGESYDLVKLEISRVISNALMADDRVTAVEDFEIQQKEKNLLLITFNVTTVYGDIVASKEVAV